MIEDAGISTICMSSALDITKAVKPPRAVFLDYPLGHTVGKLNNFALQHKILKTALGGLASLKVPGSIKKLPFKWDDDDKWKSNVFKDSLPPVRPDTPQYQCEEDRALAELNTHN